VSEKAPSRIAGDTVSEKAGRGAAWTEERRRSDEGRRRLRAPRRIAGDTVSEKAPSRIAGDTVSGRAGRKQAGERT